MKLKEFLNIFFLSKKNEISSDNDEFSTLISEARAEIVGMEKRLDTIMANQEYLAGYKASYKEPLCTKCGKPTRASELHGGANGLCPDCHNAMVYRNQERNAESHAVSAVARMYGCSHEAARFILKR